MSYRGIWLSSSGMLVEQVTKVNWMMIFVQEIIYKNGESLFNKWDYSLCIAYNFVSLFKDRHIDIRGN